MIFKLIMYFVTLVYFIKLCSLDYAFRRHLCKRKPENSINEGGIKTGMIKNAVLKKTFMHTKNMDKCLLH